MSEARHLGGVTKRHGGEEAGHSHLVIKRGHLGRYRFTLLTGSGRVTGEVRVEMDGAPRHDQDALARAEIHKLAARLLAVAADQDIS